MGTTPAELDRACKRFEEAFAKNTKYSTQNAAMPSNQVALKSGLKARRDVVDRKPGK